jgi:hypothetical protein
MAVPEFLDLIIRHDAVASPSSKSGRSSSESRYVSVPLSPYPRDLDNILLPNRRPLLDTLEKFNKLLSICIVGRILRLSGDRAVYRSSA